MMMGDGRVGGSGGSGGDDDGCTIIIKEKGSVYSGIAGFKGGKAYKQS